MYPGRMYQRTRLEKLLMLSLCLTRNFFTTALFYKHFNWDFLCFLVRFDTKSQGRQISLLSRLERSVQSSASTGQLPTHDYTTLIIVSQLSIWGHRQQGCICKTHSQGLLEWAYRWWKSICCWLHRNAWYNQEVQKIGTKKGALTRSSLCHLNGCDPQGPDITLHNTQGTRSVSIFHMFSQHSALTHTHKHSAAVTL